VPGQRDSQHTPYFLRANALWNRVLFLPWWQHLLF
jgi:hypothetical protein